MKRKAEEEKKDNEDDSNKTKKAAVKEPVIAKDQDEYLKKRLVLLEKEKELTKVRDEVSKLRQDLPWVEVSKEYIFDGPDGSLSLEDLFKEKSQLVVHHFMFNPAWDAGCKSCSFMADHMGSDAARKHLAAKDVSYVAIGRAPISKLESFRARMGWKTDFYSSNQNDFNYDFNVSFRKEEFEKNQPPSVHYSFGDKPFFMEDFPGISVFALSEGKIYHTYSVYSRGLDPFITTYQFLDIVPKGRNEGKESYKMSWVKLNDEY